MPTDFRSLLEQLKTAEQGEAEVAQRSVARDVETVQNPASGAGQQLRDAVTASYRRLAVGISPGRYADSSPEYQRLQLRVRNLHASLPSETKEQQDYKRQFLPTVDNVRRIAQLAGIEITLDNPMDEVSGLEAWGLAASDKLNPAGIVGSVGQGVLGVAGIAADLVGAEGAAKWLQTAARESGNLGAYAREAATTGLDAVGLVREANAGLPSVMPGTPEYDELAQRGGALSGANVGAALQSLVPFGIAGRLGAGARTMATIAGLQSAGGQWAGDTGTPEHRANRAIVSGLITGLVTKLGAQFGPDKAAEFMRLSPEQLQQMLTTRGAARAMLGDTAGEIVEETADQFFQDLALKGEVDPKALLETALVTLATQGVAAPAMVSTQRQQVHAEQGVRRAEDIARAPAPGAAAAAADNPEAPAAPEAPEGAPVQAPGRLSLDAMSGAGVADAALLTGQAAAGQRVRGALRTGDIVEGIGDGEGRVVGIIPGDDGTVAGYEIVTQTGGAPTTVRVDASEVGPGKIQPAERGVVDTRVSRTEEGLTDREAISGVRDRLVEAHKAGGLKKEDIEGLIARLSARGGSSLGQAVGAREALADINRAEAAEQAGLTAAQESRAEQVRTASAAFSTRLAQLRAARRADKAAQTAAEQKQRRIEDTLLNSPMMSRVLGAVEDTANRGVMSPELLQTLFPDLLNVERAELAKRISAAAKKLGRGRQGAYVKLPDKLMRTLVKSIAEDVARTGAGRSSYWVASAISIAQDLQEREAAPEPETAPEPESDEERAQREIQDRAWQAEEDERYEPPPPPPEKSETERQMEELMSAGPDEQLPVEQMTEAQVRAEIRYGAMSGTAARRQMALRKRLRELTANAPAQPAQPAQRATRNIWYSTGENANLSNLAARPFTYEGRQYHSVEHAYQSNKSGRFNEADYIRGRNAGPGTKVPGTAGTDKATSAELMMRLLEASFEQNPDAKQALLATGDDLLTHTQDTGMWGRAFPQMLMMLRDKFRSAKPAARPAAKPAASPEVAQLERILARYEASGDEVRARAARDALAEAHGAARIKQAAERAEQEDAAREAKQEAREAAKRAALAKNIVPRTEREEELRQKKTRTADEEAELQQLRQARIRAGQAAREYRPTKAEEALAAWEAATSKKDRGRAQGKFRRALGQEARQLVRAEIQKVIDALDDLSSEAADPMQLGAEEEAAAGMAHDFTRRDMRQAKRDVAQFKREVMEDLDAFLADELDRNEKTGEYKAPMSELRTVTPEDLVEEFMRQEVSSRGDTRRDTLREILPAPIADRVLTLAAADTDVGADYSNIDVNAPVPAGPAATAARSELPGPGAQRLAPPAFNDEEGKNDPYVQQRMADAANARMLDDMVYDQTEEDDRAEDEEADRIDQLLYLTRSGDTGRDYSTPLPNRPVSRGPAPTESAPDTPAPKKRIHGLSGRATQESTEENRTQFPRTEPTLVGVGRGERQVTTSQPAIVDVSPQDRRLRDAEVAQKLFGPEADALRGVAVRVSPQVGKKQTTSGMSQQATALRTLLTGSALGTAGAQSVRADLVVAPGTTQVDPASGAPRFYVGEIEVAGSIRYIVVERTGDKYSILGTAGGESVRRGASKVSEIEDTEMSRSEFGVTTGLRAETQDVPGMPGVRVLKTTFVELYDAALLAMKADVAFQQRGDAADDVAMLAAQLFPNAHRGRKGFDGSPEQLGEAGRELAWAVTMASDTSAEYRSHEELRAVIKGMTGYAEMLTAAGKPELAAAVTQLVTKLAAVKKPRIRKAAQAEITNAVTPYVGDVADGESPGVSVMAKNLETQLRVAFAREASRLAGKQQKTAADEIALGYFNGLRNVSVVASSGNTVQEEIAYLYAAARLEAAGGDITRLSQQDQDRLVTYGEPKEDTNVFDMAIPGVSIKDVLSARAPAEPSAAEKALLDDVARTHGLRIDYTDRPDRALINGTFFHSDGTLWVNPRLFGTDMLPGLLLHEIFHASMFRMVGADGAFRDGMAGIVQGLPGGLQTLTMLTEHYSSYRDKRIGVRAEEALAHTISRLAMDHPQAVMDLLRGAPSLGQRVLRAMKNAINAVKQVGQGISKMFKMAVLRARSGLSTEAARELHRLEVADAYYRDKLITLQASLAELSGIIAANAALTAGDKQAARTRFATWLDTMLRNSSYDPVRTANALLDIDLRAAFTPFNVNKPDAALAALHDLRRFEQGARGLLALVDQSPGILPGPLRESLVSRAQKVAVARTKLEVDLKLNGFKTIAPLISEGQLSASPDVPMQWGDQHGPRSTLARAMDKIYGTASSQTDLEQFAAMIHQYAADGYSGVTKRIDPNTATGRFVRWTKRLWEAMSRVRSVQNLRPGKGGIHADDAAVANLVRRIHNIAPAAQTDALATMSAALNELMLEPDRAKRNEQARLMQLAYTLELMYSQYEEAIAGLPPGAKLPALPFFDATELDADGAKAALFRMVHEVRAKIARPENKLARTAFETLALAIREQVTRPLIAMGKLHPDMEDRLWLHNRVFDAAFTKIPFVRAGMTAESYGSDIFKERSLPWQQYNVAIDERITDSLQQAFAATRMHAAENEMKTFDRMPQIRRVLERVNQTEHVAEIDRLKIDESDKLFDRIAQVVEYWVAAEEGRGYPVPARYFAQFPAAVEFLQKMTAFSMDERARAQALKAELGGNTLEARAKMNMVLELIALEESDQDAFANHVRSTFLGKQRYVEVWNPRSVQAKLAAVTEADKELWPLVNGMSFVQLEERKELVTALRGSARQQLRELGTATVVPRDTYVTVAADTTQMPLFMPTQVAEALAKSVIDPTAAVRAAKAASSAKTRQPGDQNLLRRAWTTTSRWVLQNPLSVATYFYSNIVSNWSALLTTNPGAALDPKYLGDAFTLLSSFYTDKGATLPALKQRQLAHLTANSIVGGSYLQMFDKASASQLRDIAASLGRSGTTMSMFKLIKILGPNAATSWGAAMVDDVFKVAAYLHNMDAVGRHGREYLMAHTSGEIAALIAAAKTDAEAAAIKARFDMGDFADLSPLGEWLRKNVMPFYPWVEVNLRRVARLVTAPFTGQKTASQRATLAAQHTIGLTAVSFMVSILNSLLMGDDDEEEAARAGFDPHGALFMGWTTDANGVRRMRSMPVGNILQEALSTFGLGNYKAAVREAVEAFSFSGARPVPQYLQERLLDTVTSLTNRVSPLYSMLSMAITAPMGQAYAIGAGTPLAYPVARPRDALIALVGLRKLQPLLGDRPTAEMSAGQFALSMLTPLHYSDPEYLRYVTALADVRNLRAQIDPEAAIKPLIPSPRSTMSVLSNNVLHATINGSEGAIYRAITAYLNGGGDPDRLATSLDRMALLSSTGRETMQQILDRASPEQRTRILAAEEWSRKLLSPVHNLTLRSALMRAAADQGSYAHLQAWARLGAQIETARKTAEDLLPRQGEIGEAERMQLLSDATAQLGREEGANATAFAARNWLAAVNKIADAASNARFQQDADTERWDAEANKVASEYDKPLRAAMRAAQDGRPAGRSSRAFENQTRPRP